MMHDYEVVVERHEARLPAGEQGAGARGRPDAGRTTCSRSGRACRASSRSRPSTSAGGIPKDKQNVNGSASERRRPRRSPACSAARSPTTSAAARPWSPTGSPRTPARPTRSRRARCSRTADSFYEADGVAFGDPKIKAGAKVQVKGVGTEVRRRRSWSRRRRTATAAATGYQTSFQISGRSSRTLLELIRQPEERDWSATLVVGVVTNNNDPEHARSRAREVPLAVRQRGVGVGAGRHAERRQRARAADAARSPTRRSSSASSTATPAARSSLGSIVQRQGQARQRPLPEPRRIVRDALEREGAHAHEEGLRDQVRPEHDRRDHEGREAQGRRQLRAQRRPATASSRPSSTTSRPARR